MPLFLVGGGTAIMNSFGATSLALTFDNLPKEGQFILVTVAITGGTSIIITPPDPTWVLIARQNNGTNPANATFYKIATSSEALSYTFTFNNAYSTAITGVILNGVDQNNPINAVQGANGTTSSTVTYGTVTATTSYGYLMKTVAARNTTTPAFLMDPGPNSQVYIQDANPTPVCMTSAIMQDVELLGPVSIVPENSTLDQVCTKATVAFVLNEAVSPPVSWIGA